MAFPLPPPLSLGGVFLTWPNKATLSNHDLTGLAILVHSAIMAPTQQLFPLNPGVPGVPRQIGAAQEFLAPQIRLQQSCT
jgi:hypothetical protein